MHMSPLFHTCNTKTTSEYLLRIAIALSFAYPPISALIDPTPWIGYIPTWISLISPVSETALLHGFGVFEIIIAIWILFGTRIRIPALIAACVLLFITVTNYTQFLVLFRDLALAFAALALALTCRCNEPEEG